MCVWHNFGDKHLLFASTRLEDETSTTAAAISCRRKVAASVQWEPGSHNCNNWDTKHTLLLLNRPLCLQAAQMFLYKERKLTVAAELATRSAITELVKKENNNSRAKQCEIANTYTLQWRRLFTDGRHRPFVNFKRSGEACPVLARV